MTFARLIPVARPLKIRLAFGPVLIIMQVSACAKPTTSAVPGLQLCNSQPHQAVRPSELEPGRVDVPTSFPRQISIFHTCPLVCFLSKIKAGRLPL